MQVLKRVPRWGWVVLGAGLLYGVITGPSQRRGAPVAEPVPVRPVAAARQPHSVSNVFLPGAKVRLEPATPVTADETAFDRMVQAVAAQDRAGFNQLLAGGQVRVLPAATPARVLTVGVGRSQVRLASGADVWVASDLLQQP